MDTSNDLIIIGGGPAGIWGTYYAAYRGLKVQLIEKTNYLGGMPFQIFPTKTILDIPGLVQINGMEFINLLEKQLSTMKQTVQIHFNTYPTKIIKNGSDWEVLLSNKLKVKSKCLLFAHGRGTAIPNKLDNGIVKGNVKIWYVVKNIKDFATKDVFISGGGNSALDYALIMSKMNRKNMVYLAHRRNEFRGDEDKVVKTEKRRNIRILKPCKLERIEKRDKKIAVSIILDSKVREMIICDEVIIQHGFKFEKNNIVVDGLKTDNDSAAKKYITSDRFETNIKTVYITGQMSSHCAENMIQITTTNVTIAICHMINEYFSRRTSIY